MYNYQSSYQLLKFCSRGTDIPKTTIVCLEVYDLYRFLCFTQYHRTKTYQNKNIDNDLDNINLCT